MTSTIAAAAGILCGLVLSLSRLEGGSAVATLAAEPFRPSVATAGASVAAVRRGLEARCSKLEQRAIDPPFIVLRAHVRRGQVQLDCDGLLFAQERRWAEFVFADDSLDLVWILTAPRTKHPCWNR